MTFKNIISKFKLYPKGPITIHGVWTAELLVFSVLLILVFAFDFWIYRNFVVKREAAAVAEKPESRILLNSGNLEYLKTKFAAHQNFLENPHFPSARDPF